MTEIKTNALPIAQLALTTAQTAAGDISAHTGATSGVHGTTGNVVGDSDIQTLSNKSIEFGDSANVLAYYATGIGLYAQKTNTEFIQIQSNGDLYLECISPDLDADMYISSGRNIIILGNIRSNGAGELGQADAPFGNAFFSGAVTIGTAVINNDGTTTGFVHDSTTTDIHGAVGKPLGDGESLIPSTDNSFDIGSTGDTKYYKDIAFKGVLYSGNPTENGTHSVTSYGGVGIDYDSTEMAYGISMGWTADGDGMALFNQSTIALGDADRHGTATFNSSTITLGDTSDQGSALFNSGTIQIGDNSGSGTASFNDGKISLGDANFHGKANFNNSRIALGDDNEHGTISANNGTIIIGNEPETGVATFQSAYITIGDANGHGEALFNNGTITLGDDNESGIALFNDGKIQLGDDPATGWASFADGNLTIDGATGDITSSQIDDLEKRLTVRSGPPTSDDDVDAGFFVGCELYDKKKLQRWMNIYAGTDSAIWYPVSVTDKHYEGFFDEDAFSVSGTGSLTYESETGKPSIMVVAYTGATDRYRLPTGGDAATSQFNVTDAGTIIFEVVTGVRGLNEETTPTRVRHLHGFTDSTTGLPSNGVVVVYSNETSYTSNWVLRTSSGGTVTEVDTGIAVVTEQMQHFVCVCKSGSVKLYSATYGNEINFSTPVATSTTNIPTADMFYQDYVGGNTGNLTTTVKDKIMYRLIYWY